MPSCVEDCVRSLVLQPTTLCNLDCRYCYLPQRDKNLRMSGELVRRLADDLQQFSEPVELIWHGGEPLACGIDHFSRLLEPLQELEQQGRITHSVQTNATLIDERWCELFRAHHVRVGVSIDGPQWANTSRVDWSGREAFDRIQRGIEALKDAGIEFSVIAVVGEETLTRAAEFYAFFCEAGCPIVGINFAENEGANRRDPVDDERVTRFWADLFAVWKANPSRIRIRELNYVLTWMDFVCAVENPSECLRRELLPTVAWNGDVVLLSPELLGGQSDRYGNFVVGNLFEASLLDIITRGREALYVTEFNRGILRCQEECQYFSFCAGGQASNKFFELGTMEGTETTYCRNVKKRVVDATLNSL